MGNRGCLAEQMQRNHRVGFLIPYKGSVVTMQLPMSLVSEPVTISSLDLQKTLMSLSSSWLLSNVNTRTSSSLSIKRTGYIILLAFSDC